MTLCAALTRAVQQKNSSLLFSNKTLNQESKKRKVCALLRPKEINVRPKK